MKLTPEEIAHIAHQRWESCPDKILDRLERIALEGPDAATAYSLQASVNCFVPNFTLWLAHNREVLVAFREANGVVRRYFTGR